MIYKMYLVILAVLRVLIQIGTFLLLLAGTSVGIMFSLVTYDNNSIWASALIHALWNVIMIGGIIRITTAYDSKHFFLSF